jgi:hypothetical protein
MLCKTKVSVCCQIHTKQINALCRHSLEFLVVKPGGTAYRVTVGLLKVAFDCM